MDAVAFGRKWEQQGSQSWNLLLPPSLQLAISLASVRNGYHPGEGMWKIPQFWNQEPNHIQSINAPGVR